MTNLYARDAKNNIRVWGIEPYGTYGLVTSSGILGGAITNKTVKVTPKANRTQREQVRLEIESRIKIKIDAGFVKSIEEAKTNERTNALGFKRPMLAMAKVFDFDSVNSHVQIKYDGLRCLITNIDGKLYAYSKTGKMFDCIDHILDGINIPEGVTIDGELYSHKTPLQTINSWVKRKQKDTKKLDYRCYDIVNDHCFEDRIIQLQKYNLGKFARVVKTWRMAEIDITRLFNEVREDGYEGLIIRQPNFGYQSGKRNKAMIKVKQFLDGEFIICGINATKEGFARLLLKTATGRSFVVLAPGTHAEKREILNNAKDYIGTFINITYAHTSIDGIPQQPIARYFRDFE